MEKKSFLNIKNLGFMQGRLVNSPYGKIQCFPAKEWKEELKIASKNNFKILEWTVNSVNLNQNPIFHKKKLNEIFLYKKKYNIKINSLTCDYFMEKPFFKIKKEKKIVINNLKKLLANSERLKIRYFVVPLVDTSSIQNKKEEDIVVNFFNDILKNFSKKINILFEIDYSPNQILEFLKRFNSKRIGINYDSGNSASIGYNFEEEKKYFNYIKNFHVKDRFYKGKTVRLGKGNSNLLEILKYFKYKKYKGNFILQTARDKKKKHLKELLINRKYLFDLGI